jgi:Fibronectin type III domain
VQVQAVNRVGGGPLSPAGQGCATPLKDSPSQVTGVQASESAPGQVSLSWRQPSLGPYHTPIARYTVRGGPAPLTVTPAGAVVKALSAGTTYSFTIVATNKSGNTGPASTAARITTWSKPGPVTKLTVQGGDDQLTISWTAAHVPSGSPKVTGYTVTVGKGSSSTTQKTSITKTAPAWTTETITVAAVNSVGTGKSSTASGTAWTRAVTHLCVDSLNGDHAIENTCTNTGGAWTDEGTSSVSWIHYPVTAGGRPAGTNEYLCTTYYESAPGLSGTKGVSGDVYALVTSPSNQACTQKLPSYQKPDTPHPIAYVSTTQTNSSSRHVCEYEGRTTGANGTFTAFELSPCGTKPSGMSSASEKFSFWT